MDVDWRRISSAIDDASLAFRCAGLALHAKTRHAAKQFSSLTMSPLVSAPLAASAAVPTVNSSMSSMDSLSETVKDHVGTLVGVPDIDRQPLRFLANPPAPIVRVSAPKGFFCKLDARFYLPIPPKDVFDMITADDNDRVFKNIKEVNSRTLISTQGDEETMRLVSVARWQFLVFSGTFSTTLIVTQNRKARTVKFRLDKPGFMKRFDGGWAVSAITPRNLPHVLKGGSLRFDKSLQYESAAATSTPDSQLAHSPSTKAGSSTKGGHKFGTGDDSRAASINPLFLIGRTDVPLQPREVLAGLLHAGAPPVMMVVRQARKLLRLGHAASVSEATAALLKSGEYASPSSRHLSLDATRSSSSDLLSPVSPASLSKQEPPSAGFIPPPAQGHLPHDQLLSADDDIGGHHHHPHPHEHAHDASEILGTWVELRQSVQPAIPLPPMVSGYMRSIITKVTHDMIHDMAAEAKRIQEGRPIPALAAAPPAPSKDASWRSLQKSTARGRQNRAAAKAARRARRRKQPAPATAAASSEVAPPSKAAEEKGSAQAPELDQEGSSALVTA